MKRAKKIELASFTGHTYHVRFSHSYTCTMHTSVVTDSNFFKWTIILRGELKLTRQSELAREKRSFITTMKLGENPPFLLFRTYCTVDVSIKPLAVLYAIYYTSSVLCTCNDTSHLSEWILLCNLERKKPPIIIHQIPFEKWQSTKM